MTVQAVNQGGPASLVITSATELADIPNASLGMTALVTDDGTQWYFNGSTWLVSGASYIGAGSPEGVLTAPAGALYRRTDGGAGTTLYVKESGADANGWIAK